MTELPHDLVPGAEAADYKRHQSLKSSPTDVRIGLVVFDQGNDTADIAPGHGSQYSTGWSFSEQIEGQIAGQGANAQQHGIGRVPRPSSARAGVFGLITENSSQSITGPFPASHRSFGIYLHARNAGRIMAETAPRPILRLFCQPASDGIAGKIASLLYLLCFTPDIEIAITGRPKRVGGA